MTDKNTAYEKITELSILLNMNVRGMLAAYYLQGIDGLDISEPTPRVRVERLAMELGEPVTLARDTHMHGTVGELYVPDNFRARRENPGYRSLANLQVPQQGAWLKPYSYTKGDIVTSVEMRFEMAMSGALVREKPIHLVQFQVGSDRSECENRLKYLFAKTGEEIIAEFNGRILNSVLLANPESAVPLHPTEYAHGRALENYRGHSGMLLRYEA